MSDPNTPAPLDRMVEAYERMLERVDGLLKKAGDDGLPRLKDGLLHAREKAVELEELSREEAERISHYLERDVNDAASYLARTGSELRDWLRFETHLVEERVADLFLGVADRTVVELEQLAEQAAVASIYKTGEVTGPGTLICGQCGETMRFVNTSRIPPCPRCHATVFQRQEGPEEIVDDSAA